MNYEPIGNCIQLIDNKNKDLSVSNLLGLNIKKNFIPSVANVEGTDLSNYKVIQKGQFATNTMRVGRDKRLPVSLYKLDNPAIISPAYKVFKVIDESELLPEYLMIEFHRGEFDRRAWFYCDSSIRAGIEWNRFCEIEIPIPDIEVQKKYVSIYKGLLNNQKTYENSLVDLKLICDTYIENLIKTEESKTLGNYIQKSDIRNKDLEINNLLGLSINKVFIPSKSNKENLDLSKYKVVKPRQFSYVTITSRNGNKISIAILDGDSALVSNTYIVFLVKDSEELLPEYLNLFFQRIEFDRYARFHSWGSVREAFNWNDLCNVKLPIPSIEKQEAIVSIYHTLKARRKINQQLIDSIKPLCPVLMRGAVESDEIH